MSTVWNFDDVLLVPFPFTDQQGSKQRPAVVVSSSAYNANRPDVLLMAITSVMRSAGVALAVGEAVLADWQSAGLIKPSVVKPVNHPQATAHHQAPGCRFKGRCGAAASRAGCGDRVAKTVSKRRRKGYQLSTRCPSA